MRAIIIKMPFEEGVTPTLGEWLSPKQEQLRGVAHTCYTDPDSWGTRAESLPPHCPLGPRYKILFSF